MKGDLDEARNQFKAAHTAAPDAVWVLHELAETCQRMGRSEEASAHLEHALALAPFDPATYGYIAQQLRGEGRDAEALAHLEKAVELDPGYTWAWRELAELQATNGDDEAAHNAANTAAELAPDDPINHGLRAFLLRCNNKTPKRFRTSNEQPKPYQNIPGPGANWSKFSSNTAS